LWLALDENDDDLIYSVYYRGEGEKQWKLLKDNVHDQFYSWDTSSMADGAYYLKIVASDAPSNPPARSARGIARKATASSWIIRRRPWPVLKHNLRVRPLESIHRQGFCQRHRACGI